MLTSWKQTRTSFEYPLATTTSPKKKTEQKKSSNVSTSSINRIAVSFVQPLACNDPFYQERADPLRSSAGGSKKRRKGFNDRVGGEGSNVDDMEPVLCLTSSHRVALVGRGGGGTSGLIESKSRSYVSRPGMGSSFVVASASGDSTNATSDVSFTGMTSSGAQYDPTSNLVYGIRNGGAEIAVWTATSSSILQGPDDDSQMGGKRGDELSKNQNGKKRKPKQQEPSLLPEGVVAQRLSLPEGKTAVTLTPFSIPLLPSLKGKQNLGAVGASGCCADGSIWVVIQSHENTSDSPFELVILDGSVDENRTNGAADNSNRRTKAVANKSSGWKVMDSRVVGSSDGGDKGPISFNLAVNSVVFSEDEGQVALRHHQVRIVNGDDNIQCRLDKSTNQPVVQLDKDTPFDVTAKLDASGDSLIVAHRYIKGGWAFSSVDLSQTGGALVNSLVSTHLPDGGHDRDNATLFSFGCVGKHTFAVLTKESTSFILKIMDLRRKAELSSLSWVEGGSNNGPLNKLLQGKRCHAMITNELDGSIALVTSPIGEKGCISLVCTKVETTLVDNQNNASESSNYSLALALRAAASTGTSTASTNSTAEGISGNSLASMLSSITNNLADRNAVGKAVESACNHLIQAAKATREKEVDSAAANGKSRKSSSKKEAKGSCDWKNSYDEGVAIIHYARGEGVAADLIHGLKNGMKGNSKAVGGGDGGLPKRFVEVAFKESVSLLVSLNKEGKKDTRQGLLSVLVEVLETGLISAREEYGVDVLNGDNVFISILKASLDEEAPSKSIGALHVIGAMLKHVRDIPERVLVFTERFVLRNVGVSDVVAYYSQSSSALKGRGLSKKGVKLANQYIELKTADKKDALASKLLSEAVLDSTSQIVSYSKCNHSFLSKAMRDVLSSSGEVETLLLTLAKILRSGDGASPQSYTGGVSLCSGAIYWVSALTDAHLGTILNISNEGGLVIERTQSAVRSTMAQSDLANELKEISDRIAGGIVAISASKAKKSVVVRSARSLEAAIAPYSTERLAF